MKVETIPLISHTPTYHRVILAKLIRNSILLNRTSDLQNTKFFYITKLQDIATFYPKIYNLDRYIIFRFFKQIMSTKIKIDLGLKKDTFRRSIKNLNRRSNFLRPYSRKIWIIFFLLLYFFKFFASDLISRIDLKIIQL